MRSFPPFLAAALLALASSLPAADDGDVFIEPAEAGPDFAVQGEYVGENSAAQVIALGGGKFHIVGWSHGLPGAAFDAERKAEVDAERVGDRVTFREQGWTGAIDGGTLTGTSDDGKTWTLQKTERQSPTLGAKPPAGAVVLFDGKDADAWLGGKMDARGLLQCGTKSKRAFGDCTLHVEFRIPFRPGARGQGRGNSGVYLQDRYEVQVLDSFGLAGENNECGGIYGLVKPLVNMCLPPLTWQTYDIEFESAKFDNDGRKTQPAVMTVRHNGVLIHDHVEVPRATNAAGHPEGPEPAPIQLQNHGNPVFFRNIWIVPKPAR
jgi:hypothetical protein